MNYRDLILESYLEDQDEYDTYDSYDEEFDEYDYEDEDDTSDYDDAYLEGYMYALAESTTSLRHGYNDTSDSERIKARLASAKAILANPKASKKEKEKAKMICASITKNAIKTDEDYTAPATKAEKEMRKFKSQGTKNALGNQVLSSVSNTGAHKKSVNGKALAIGGAAAAAGAAGTAAAIKIDKKYKAYKAAGGRLSKAEWLKAGKPAPTNIEKLTSKLPKKAVAEAYEDAYLETLDELGFFDFD